MSAPAGWFPDPEGQDRLRYWDGTAWTENYAPRPAGAAPTADASAAPTTPATPAPTTPAPAVAAAASAVAAPAPAVAAPAPAGYPQAGPYGGAGGAPAVPPVPGVPSGGYGQASAPAGYGQASAPGGYGQAGAPGGYGQAGGYGQPGAPGAYGGGYGQSGGPQKKNTGLIVAIVAVLVVVLGVGGYFGFRALNPDDPEPTAGPGPTSAPTDAPTDTPTEPVDGPTDAPTGDMPEMVATLTLGTALPGSFAADGSWGALLPITTPGVYLLHGVADGAEDLELTVYDEGLNAISFIDDIPQGADVLQPNSLNPLLPIYLEAGQYAVVITEIAGAPASFQVLAEDLTAIPELPQDTDVTISMTAGNVWVNYVVVDAAGTITIDARTTNDADLLMTVISPLGGWIANDDRGSDIAGQVGGDTYDPFVEEVVDPGVYILMMSEYSDGAGEAVVTVGVS
ncbi:DUF2510 domain-containing protein [Occultella gossypii]|uniref:DUF2510 domain-containing protein n=1 Tax=Occultella gossypii TaxID=2800820 RepID=UPI001CC0DA95|nr:DUF2510 domain-containing protein [Occultella gossypii]